MTFFDVIIDNTYDNSYLLNKTSFTINDIANINKYDLKKWMSPLSNFELLGSTANSLATLIEFDIPNFRCSRQFLYYNERIDTDTYNINISIKRLLEYGFCSYDIYPYNSLYINERPSDEIYKKAEEYKYKFDIIKIKKDLNSLILSIINNEPFIVSINVYESFEISLNKNETKIKIPKKDERLLGAVSIVVCGFDFNSQIFIIRYLNQYLELPFFYLLKENDSSDCFIFILRTFFNNNNNNNNTNTNNNNTKIEIKERKVVDLRSKFPEVYDQGKIGSCTANSLCSIFEYDSMNNFRGSRLFLYYNERLLINETDKDEGAYLKDGIISLKRFGIAEENDWKYLIENVFIRPPEEVYRKAKNNFVIDAINIKGTLETIKEWIDKNEPIATGIPIFSNFISNKTGIIGLPSKTDKYLGGHAVVICGYDDYQERFIVRNSWGKHWGNNGYFYLPYLYLIRDNDNNNNDFWIITKSKFYSENSQ
jgi:hypothetical protein